MDNKIGIEFNTRKKRDRFVKLVNEEDIRKITCISSVSYPWDIEDGIHNLINKEDFTKLLNCSIEKVEMAIKNKRLQIEYIGETPYIVNNNDRYRIDGIYHTIR